MFIICCKWSRNLWYTGLLCCENLNWLLWESGLCGLLLLVFNVKQQILYLLFSYWTLQFKKKCKNSLKKILLSWSESCLSNHVLNWVVSQSRWSFTLGRIIFQRFAKNDCKMDMFLVRHPWSHSGLNTLRLRQNGRQICRRHIQMHFLEWKFLNKIKIALKFVHKGPINNIPVLVQIMAWCWPGDKPLFEPMIELFAEAYVHHSASIC